MTHNPVTNQIYVVNGNSNNVTVIDGATNNTTTVAVGISPGAVAVNPNTNMIYVVDYGNDSVTVIDGANFTVVTNPSSATVTAGQSGTFTLTVTPQGSFTSPISFSCSGLPTLAGCTFSPTSVTPNSNTVTSTLTITTAAHTASLASPASPFGHRSSPLYAIWMLIPAMLVSTVVGVAAPKRRKLLSYCLVFLLVSGCLLQVACSAASNGSGGGGGGGGTPSGSYTITVTGAAARLSTR